ncbi:thiamine-phosphate kinase [Lentibacillus sp. Marseille-P4043]|uniref:thiamine-phosphate kinase n=1 Tax=Lentibacillus sp. Marseille-P4043 TaxID=2040293 RepID=UPI000D0B15E4|nr:thiamine-phosphate kinase [Lentibacillus sp. Marseille-P4043]
MDEFTFINSIKQTSYKQSSLLKGIGDDAAVFRQTSQDVVTTVDTFVENVHFSRKTMEPFHIGHRVLAANVSDMAAMGSMPAFYLVSIVIPPHWSDEELQQIYQGMRMLANNYKVDLIGGDTVSGNELAISITVIGYVDKNKARYRSSAEIEDIVFVTGTLGDSRAGFHILTQPGQYTDKEYYMNKHRLPSPRVTFSHELRQLSRIALNDVSDGIANEAAEIAEASEVSIVLDYDKLPRSAAFHQFSVDQQRNWQLFGGEDFELIGTVAKSDWPLIKQLAEQTNTKVTEIGYVDNKQTNLVYLQEKGQRVVLKKQGYTHFK